MRIPVVARTSLHDRDIRFRLREVTEGERKLRPNMEPNAKHSEKRILNECNRSRMAASLRGHIYDFSFQELQAGVGRKYTRLHHAIVFLAGEAVRLQG
jgi:hypothetical protein